MISDEVLAKLLHQHDEAVQAYAKALHDSFTLEGAKHAVRARLMSQYEQEGAKSAAAQERDAYRDPAWMEWVAGFAAAKEQEALTKGRLWQAERRIDLIRTREASRRVEMKNLR